MAALSVFWMGLPKWVQDLLKFIGILFVVIVAGKAIAESLKAEGARRAKEKFEREQLKEQGRVDATLRQQAQENQDASNRADDAVRDLPRYRHTDELRARDASLGEIVLGADRSGGS